MIPPRAVVACDMADKQVIKTIATNRRARFEYHIEETIEAGLVLSGTEVKSLRAGKASLVDAYATFDRGEAFIYNLQINPYEQGNRYNQPEKRARKLLLHRVEIDRLMGQVSQKGYTVVALHMYFKGSRVKIELGLAKGKKTFDKREDIKSREVKRELDRTIKESRR
jgi:SsrA-binding protein